MIIGLLVLLVLGAAVAARAARRDRRVVLPAAVLAVLAVAVQPLLGAAGQHVSFLGGLHAINGLAIFGLTGWLTGQAARLRAPRSR
jgi:hypothetical protein